MMKNLISRLLLVTILATSGPSFAALISFEDDEYTAESGSLSLPKFDMSLGILTNVQLYLEVFAAIAGNLHGFEPDECTADLVCPIDTPTGTVNATMGVSLGDISLSVQAAGTAPPFECDFDDTRGIVICDTDLSVWDSDDQASGTTATLAAFAGVGNFSIPFNFENDVYGVGIFEARVEYTYDERVAAVPAPATLALLGIGLAGLGVARRRRAQ